MTDQLMPVFIHSSFRTGSTWLWSKFRKNNECYCYYEIFHEIMCDLDFRTISLSANNWNSHHPSGAPYFSEFSPLLGGNKGISGYDRGMALADFFLEPDGDPARVEKLRGYLSSLVDVAQQNGRTPVLSCTRSIGRVKTIKTLIGGTQILLKRRLLNQWFSYSNQCFFSNPYFISATISTVNYSPPESFISVVKDMLRDNNIADYDENIDYDIALVAFLVLHIYLYAKHNYDFDIIIDFDHDVSSVDLKSAEDHIRKVTSIDVDLSDYRESITAPFKLIKDIDRVVLLVRSLFAKGIAGVDDKWLRLFVDRELRDFHSGYQQYIRIAGSAHQQLAHSAGTYLQRATELENATQELASLRQSTGEQIGALQTQLTEATGQRDTAEQEHAHVQAALDRGAVEGGQRIAQLEQDVASINQHRFVLEQQMIESDTAKAAVQADALAWQKRNADLEQALQTLQGQQAALRAQLTEATGQRDTAEQEHADAQAALDRSAVEGGQRIAQLEQDVASINQRRFVLEQQMMESDAAKAAAQADALAWKKRNVELEQALQTLQGQQATLQAQLTEAEGQRDAAERIANQERASSSSAIAKMNYVLNGQAEQDEHFARRWDAMIKRLK